MDTAFRRNNRRQIGKTALICCLWREIRYIRAKIARLRHAENARSTGTVVPRRSSRGSPYSVPSKGEPATSAIPCIALARPLESAIKMRIMLRSGEFICLNSACSIRYCQFQGYDDSRGHSQCHSRTCQHCVIRDEPACKRGSLEACWRESLSMR